MEALADRIRSELRVLTGQPISDCWRAANMQVFGFGKRRLTRNRKGEGVEVSDIRIHVQCRWRFVDHSSILFGRDDLNYPADERIPREDFDWDKEDSMLDVTQRAWFDRQRSSLPKVIGVDGDAFGGFKIHLEGGFLLEGFSCDSQRGEYSELWRLLGHREDGSHFVVTGYGVEEKSGSGPSERRT
jgi:hypothetical protein